MGAAKILPAVSLLLLMFGVVSAGPPFSGNIITAASCTDGCCIESYPAEYIITLDNPVGYAYTITEYWIQSVSARTVNGTRFRNQNILLDMHSQLTLNIDADLPEPSNNSFSFQACILHNYEETPGYMVNDTEVCGDITVKTIYPMEIYFGTEICCTDTVCGSTEQCLNNYTCSPLTCGSNEYIDNHRCVPHECMVDTDCNETSTCMAYGCRPIICDGTIVNRECHGTITGAVFSFFDIIMENLVIIGLVVFIVVFVIALVWFVRLEGNGKRPGDKGGKKKGKEGKKKSKKKEEPAEDESVPLIELPEE
jgi:hypothetical protein